MKKFIFCFLFLAFTGFNAFSQLNISNYNFSVFGFSTSPDKIISGELKVFAGNTLEMLPLELDVFYNFDPGDYHRFSVGLGINASPFTGGDPVNALLVPVQLQLFPFQDLRKFSLVLELAPQFPDNNPALRGLMGIRYSFSE